MALEGTVAFTGRLASMRRADAFALVPTHGGKPREGVTKQTNVLIVGEFGWPLLDDGRPSNSLARAKSYRVLIASERQFLQWLGKSAPEEQAKTYSADQLASLSKLPKEIVEQLSMFGLIEARNGLYGFRDLAAARQVAGLLAAGTALSVITKSLHEIRKWLPDAGLSNLKLFPESSDRARLMPILHMLTPCSILAFFSSDWSDTTKRRGGGGDISCSMVTRRGPPVLSGP